MSTVQRTEVKGRFLKQPPTGHANYQMLIVTYYIPIMPKEKKKKVK